MWHLEGQNKTKQTDPSKNGKEQETHRLSKLICKFAYNLTKERLSIKQCVTVKVTRSGDTISFKGQSSLIDRALTQPRLSSGTHRPEVSPPLPIGTEVHLSIASPLENLETAR